MARRSRLSLSTLFVCLLLVSVSQADTTGIGGPYGEYAMAYQGPETLTLFVVPDGSGDAFDQAGLPYGGTEDATITLILLDASELPIASFPREDLWLESEDYGLVPCVGGTIADANTDANGITRWHVPPLGGGHSQALTVISVNGMSIEYTSGVRLSFNSPDINGDRIVNLTDVGIFAEDFFGDDNFRSDFHRDGMVNLSDLSQLSQAIGANCP